MIKNTFTSLGIAIAALATAAYSCSSSDTGVKGLGLGAPPITGKGGAGGSQPAAGGSTGLVGNASGGSANGGAGATPGGGNQPSINVDAGNQDADTTIDEDAACGTGKVSAMLKQVDMFVMFDRSGSMNECVDGSAANTACADQTVSRWALTSAALKLFFQDPTADGLNVALRFFPDDRPAVGCDGYPTMGGGFMGGGFMGGAAGTTGMTGAAGGPNCDTNACSQPLVDIGPLTTDPAPTDTQEAALVAAVDAAAPPTTNAFPSPGTPTSAALGGAVQWATQHQMGHTDIQTVIVFVTDGEPNGCDTNLANIAKIASDARTNAGILTYVIGLNGGNAQALQSLNQIAAGGGTMQAIFVDASSAATQQLLTALLAIKGMALSCDLDVPTSDEAGMKIDPHLINVNYSSGTGMPTELAYVDNLAACSTALAWYYDDPANPTKAILCPSTCDTVKADSTANLQILAGCQPHVVAR